MNPELTKVNFEAIIKSIIIFIISLFCMSILHNFKHPSYDGTFYDLIIPKETFSSEILNFVGQFLK